MALPSPSDFAAYGGKLKNYTAGIEDPTTDRDAKAVNQALSDLAMMTRMCPRAWCQFNASNAPTIVSHDAVWGNATLLAPTVARTSAGVFTLTWPASIIDHLGETRSVSFRWGDSNVSDSTAKHSVQVKRTSANVATVYTYDAAGAAADISVPVDVVMY